MNNINKKISGNTSLVMMNVTFFFFPTYKTHMKTTALLFTGTNLEIVITDHLDLHAGAISQSCGSITKRINFYRYTSNIRMKKNSDLGVGLVSVTEHLGFLHTTVSRKTKTHPVSRGSTAC